MIMMCHIGHGVLWHMDAYGWFWMYMNDYSWITYSLFRYPRWMLVTLSFALLCFTWSRWTVMCQAGVNAAVVMFDLEAMGTPCLVMIRWLCWFATVCQNLRVMSKLFMMQVTWPPPQTNERVGGYEFLGGEAEAKQIKEINDFWDLLIEVFSISCLGRIFVILSS